MSKIIEREINGERVFLKRGMSGYRVVHPWKIDGKIVWKNFLAGGNWLNIVYVIGFVSIILLAIGEYYSNLKLASACLRALPDSVDLSLYLNNPELTSDVFNFTGFN